MGRHVAAHTEQMGDTEPMDDTEPITAALREPGALITDRRFTGALPVEAEMRGLEFEGCMLHACRWQGQQMEATTFGECHFVGCNISAVSLNETSFRECSFTGTKALGMDWTRARVSELAAAPMAWQDCALDFSTLSGLSMAGWTFRGCSLREIHLVGSDVRRASFSECDISGATISECDLREARFTDCVGVAFDARDNRVAGLTVSASMAPDLLSPLGIVVR